MKAKIGPVGSYMLDSLGTYLQGSNGDEFVAEGSAIHDSWRTAWPQAIARAWRVEYAMKNKKASFNYKLLSNVIKDALTKKKISNLIKMINDAEKTKEITPEESKRFKQAITASRADTNDFIKELLDSVPAAEVLNWFYKITLRKDPGLQNIGRIESADFEWYKKLLSHKSELVLDALMEEGFMVDAMENPPVNFERNLSSRLIVRKPDQSYEVTGKRKPYSTYKMSFDRTNRLSVTHAMPPQEDIRVEFKGSRVNGWQYGEGLGHVVVLTLPPCPHDAQFFGLAVTDYEAAGKVFMFTFTC